jgi:TRAP-type mannitol/chloroaromatic compound transport system permease small subunit
LQLSIDTDPIMQKPLATALLLAAVAITIVLLFLHDFAGQSADKRPSVFLYLIPAALLVLAGLVLVARNGFLAGIDLLNTMIGQIFSWSILVLTLAVCYEVFSRYVMNRPTAWAYDVSYILYGTLFMTAGAYALARNGHVRGDFLYRNWPPRTQAKMDLALYLLFYFPGIIALIYSGWEFSKFAWTLNERSAFSPDGPIVWPFKAVIPVVGVLMLLQGIVESIRCVQCIKTGEWPQRLHDVEEMEKLILEEAAAKAAAEERTAGAR